jgi:hypothetical protein
LRCFCVAAGLHGFYLNGEAVDKGVRNLHSLIVEQEML